MNVALNLFKGRLNRRDYLIGYLVVFFIIAPFYLAQDFSYLFEWGLDSNLIKLWLLVITPFVFIPYLSINVRRLHDIGLSGWVYILSFIPIIDVIFWIYLFFAKGQNSQNKYGVVPPTKSSFKRILFNLD